MCLKTFAVFYRFTTINDSIPADTIEVIIDGFCQFYLVYAKK